MLHVTVHLRMSGSSFPFGHVLHTTQVALVRPAATCRHRIKHFCSHTSDLPSAVLSSSVVMSGVSLCRCMLDVAPRVLTVQEVNMLCNFAELAVRELERKQVVRPAGECHTL